MTREFTTEAEDILKEISAIAIEYFQNSPPTHDWEHTLRVVSLCKKIGSAENADMETLLAAAYLHDIGREEADKKQICHAELSAQIAEQILIKSGFPSCKIPQALHCISTHRFRGDNPPETIEAKVLFDADKLDAIGAIGVCRAYSYAGENGQPLYTPFDEEAELKKFTNHKEHSPVIEFKVKLSRIKDSLKTSCGRALALERHKFMLAFFEELCQEIKGSK